MGKKTNFFFFFTKRPIKLYGNLQGNITQEADCLSRGQARN